MGNLQSASNQEIRSKSMMDEKDQELSKIYHTLRQEISKRKKAEDALKILRKEQAETEQKLLESYKHLGALNCQISILIDLKKQSGEKNAQELIEYIVNSAMSLARAETAVFFKYEKRENTLSLLFSAGVRSTEALKKVALKKYPGLKTFIQKKAPIQGAFPDKMLEKVKTRKKIRFFMLLPLIVKDKVGGALFLGFSSREAPNTQEFDFYEAFAVQASFILERLNILK